MVVLATKLYVSGAARERAIDSLRSLVSNRIGELEVDSEIGIRHDDFPTVTLQGPDAPVAREALTEEWGAVSVPVPSGETRIGTLTAWDENGWTVDVGEAVRIPLDGLSLGPGDGTQLVDRFGVVQHQRMEIVCGDVPRLSEDQVDQFYDWQRGPGRVTVNSVTRAEARATVNRVGHADDIITVERRGLLEQQLLCAEGTDPPGLVAAIGQYLPGEMRCVMP